MSGMQAAAPVADGNSMNYNQLVSHPGTRYFDSATDAPYIYDPASGSFYTQPE